MNRYVPMFLALMLLSAPVRASETIIDLATPDGAIAASRRLYCTDKDGEPVYWSWQGDVYARITGEKDRYLFRVQGLNVRTCVSTDNPTRGKGFQSLSRELLIYLDPQTGKPLSHWTNPWTNEVVDVIHVANDPVNNDFYPRQKDGAQYFWRGSSLANAWFLTITIPLFYSNPLGGAFQAEVGGTYHASEMFHFMGDIKSLTDKSIPTADVDVGWVRISDWLPWMKMSGREGFIYMNTAGRKLLKWDEVPEIMRKEVADRYPIYRAPPPLDDRRPNVTSWSYYKDVREGRETPPKRE